MDAKKADTLRVMTILFDKLKVPPCVTFAFMQSICYGWLTDKRLMNYPVRPCVFCCNDPTATDDFYHYAVCSVVWRVYAKIGLGSPPHEHHCIRHLLLIVGTDNMELRMAFLHACMISVHKLRGPAFAVKRENRERYIMANFKCSVSRDSNLKRLYNQLWS